MKAVRSTLAGLALVLGGFSLWAAAPPPVPPSVPSSLVGYRTVREAISTQISRASPTPALQPGYLGLSCDNLAGKLVISEIAGNSPAARAGLAVGDVLLQVDGQGITDPGALADLVRSRGPGREFPVVVSRQGKPVSCKVVLTSISKPLHPATRAVLGVTIDPVAEGLRLTGISAGLAAEKAKLKVGDILLAVDGVKLAGQSRIEKLAGKEPGDRVQLTVKRSGKVFEATAILVAEPDATRNASRDWDDRRTIRFTKSVYKLAVLPIEYPDVKHNTKITARDWHQSLFSTRSYIGKSPTGQSVHGSLNDFYLEQSCGQFHVTGQMFNWVTVKRKRAEYSEDSNRTALFAEALDLLLARDKKALDGFDGVFFLYAGERFQTRRGGLYWPHRSTMTYRGKRWSYFICPEGGKTMASISTISHEFGHMLGLPDLYARPEVPGQEGLGVWCTMSVGHGRDGKPLHFSAWCKEQMGWLKPVLIDPRVKQKLLLSPVEGSASQCVKVLVRADGSEYLLLENRRKIGFDRDLPGEGLLIWRVIDGRPVLEESHGIAGPSGPNQYRESVPYPSGSNTAFTPHTTPSSRSPRGGGLPVHITNIEKLPDGRIAFQIGYEYL